MSASPQPIKKLHPAMQRRESSLHRSLKSLYAQNGSQEEVVIEGYQIDVVTEDELIEIQTGGFGSLKKKIVDLTRHHRLRLVHPIPLRRQILRLSPDDGSVSSERRSPKQGKWADLFRHLVYLSGVVPRDRFSLEVLLTQESDVRVADGKGSWRRKGVSLVDRRLVSVLDRRLLQGSHDYLGLLQVVPDSQFTSKDLSRANGIALSLAQRALYFLSRCGAVQIEGRKREGILYVVSSLHLEDFRDSSIGSRDPA